jgi:hypothetical protein
MHSRAVLGGLLERIFSARAEGGRRLRSVYLAIFSFELFSFDAGNISSAG